MPKFVKGTAFVIVKKDFLAFGLALKNGNFVLLKGSSFRFDKAQNLDSYRKKADKERHRFISDKIVIFQDGVVNPVFTRDYKFKNISHCTSTILGQSRSGDSWINANGEAYPQWATKVVKKKKEAKPVFLVGTTVTNKKGMLFLVSEVVKNRDDKGKEFFEYLMVPAQFPRASGVLVPEKQVLKKLGLPSRGKPSSVEMNPRGINSDSAITKT